MSNNIVPIIGEKHNHASNTIIIMTNKTATRKPVANEHQFYQIIFLLNQFLF